MKENLSAELFNIVFPCRIGLGAGTDRDAVHLKSTLHSRYGFVEIGPVTQHQQPTTYRPGQIKRTFQPNRGVKRIISNIQKASRRRNAPALCVCMAFGNGCQDVDSIISEFETVYSLIYDFADAFSIDTSAIGANGTHPLQDDSVLTDILDSILDIRGTYDTYKPLYIKVSPDIPKEILHHMLDYARMNGVDAVMVKATKASGMDKASALIRDIRDYTLDRYPVLCDCGKLTPVAINAALDAGAQLVSGRPDLFRGFGRVKRVLTARSKAAQAAQAAPEAKAEAQTASEVPAETQPSDTNPE